MKLFGKHHYSSMLGRTGKKSPYHKKLYQYNLNGHLIKIWDGLREMQRHLKFNRQGITYHIKNKTPSVYGYKWGVQNV